MIKLSFCLTRQDHLSRSEFQDYWINKHVLLVKGFSKDLKILKYDKSPQLLSNIKEIF
jgi:hypothetical protein